MAFNLFSSFRKYKQFWMASVLLLAMITFVLLDKWDVVMGFITSGRSGTEVLTCNGRRIYTREFDDIKSRRVVANEFMRQAAIISLEKLDQLIKEQGKAVDEEGRVQDEKLHKDRLLALGRLKKDLVDRLGRKTMFEGGTKFKDLIDFIVWRDEADRLGIQLSRNAVDDMILETIHGKVIGFTPNDSFIAQQAARAGIDVIIEALGDEFRVEMAKLSVTGCRTKLIAINSGRQIKLQLFDLPVQVRYPITPEQIGEYYARNRTEVEMGLVPLSLPYLAQLTPPPTEAELQTFFDAYKNKKYNPSSDQPGFELPSTMDVHAVSADAKMPFYTILAKQVLQMQATPPVLYNPGQPLFASAITYMAQQPAAQVSRQVDYESLRNPQRASFKYVVGAQTDPFFKVGLFEPKPLDIATLVGMSTLPETSLALGGGFHKPYRPKAAPGATPESEFTGPWSFEKLAFPPNDPKYTALLQAERQRRIPVGATLVLAGAFGESMMQESLTWWANNMLDPFLPLTGPVEEEVRAIQENRLASKWALASMQKLRQALEINKGNARAFEIELDRIKRGEKIRIGKEPEQLVFWITGADGQPYSNLRWSKAAQPRNRYDIDKDDGLKPVRQSFDSFREQFNTSEGRGGTPSQLGPDDFYKLFFESEGFSVGNVPLYTPRAWPPKVTPKKTLDVAAQDVQIRDIDMFGANEQPVLFWAVAKTSARPAKDLAEVRDLVTEAWRLTKLRAALVEKGEPLPSRGAGSIQGVAMTGLLAGPFGQGPLLVLSVQPPEKGTLRDLAMRVQRAPQTQEARKAAVSGASGQFAAQPIFLSNVAPITFKKPTSPEDPGSFVPYEIPRGLIPFPRDDASKQLLSVSEGQSAVATDWKELNALNEELFKLAAKNNGSLVQILANKPRTQLYLATVVDIPPSALAGRGEALRYMGGRIIEQCQVDRGAEHLKALTEQLRASAKIETTDYGRQHYDTENAEVKGGG